MQIHEALQAGDDAPLLAGDGLDSELMLQTARRLEGVRHVRHYHAPSDHPADPLLERFEREHGAVAPSTVALTLDAMDLIIAAWLCVGSPSRPI